MSATALLSWYALHRRDLPWRATRDPYAVWVSEVMLQQTRVDTVLPRYEAFMTRFPDVAALAAASTDEVLAEWSGLGYYRRARRLHLAAQSVVAGGGEFPQTLAGWRELPGVGEYTAAAVTSMVYGVPEPVLDGNVARVVSRLECLPEGMSTAAGRRRLRERARHLIDPENPGESNQALMELGATVCTPRAPDCSACPLSTECRAFAAGEPETYPAPRRRPPIEHIRLVAVVVQNGEKTLLFRRGVDETLMPGLWELPWVDQGADSVAAGLHRRYGGRWRIESVAGRVRHAITHRVLEVEIRPGEMLAGGELGEGPEAGWFDTGARARLPLSSLVPKILRELARQAPTGAP